MNRARAVLDRLQQPLVIVHDFNVFRALARPAKADSVSPQGLRLRQKLVPTIRWISRSHHSIEHTICNGFTTVGAQALVVIDPGVDDDLA